MSTVPTIAELRQVLKNNCKVKAINTVIENFNIEAKSKPREIVNMLTIDDRFKKMFGELFTPIWLIEQMLGKLPVEVWTDKNLKFVDPACGSGNFLLVIKEKLMEGLKESIVDIKEREKHIMENMIYGVDFQEKNMMLGKMRLDPYNKFKLNLEEHDSLKFDFWGIKFDVIAMNPPYQMKSDSENKKTQSIWHKFVHKAFEICKTEGYLVAVHPCGWRNIDGQFKDTQDLMKSKNMLYLEMHNADDGMKTFGKGGATQYDWYVIKNNASYVNTTIKDVDGTITVRSIKEMDFIPSGCFDEYKHLIAEKNIQPVEMIYNCIYHNQKEYMIKTKTESHFLPCIQNINVKNLPSCLWYTNIDRGHFGTPKVIFGRMISGVMIDEKGEFGMCESCPAIVDTCENLPLIQKAMLSPKFINLMEKCDFGGMRDRYNRKILKTFRKDFYKDFLDN